MSNSIDKKVRQWGVKYTVVCSGIVLGFINFVACGAQMYQVSMDDDMKDEKISEAARDPVSVSYGIHAPRGWSEIPIRFKTGAQLSQAQQVGLRRAMETWETAVGKSLFEYEGTHSPTTGDSFTDLYSSLTDSVNGHYLDQNWSKTGKPTVVLATTIWDNDPSDSQAIETADIRFNSNHYALGDALTLTSSDGSKEVVDMETLALHELGHLLGLAHVGADQDPHSIMGPSLYIGEGLENRRLSDQDIVRIQKIYGCEGTACDLEYTLTVLDNKSRVLYSEIEGDSAH